MKKTTLWGYKIYENGVIVGLRGKEIAPKRQIVVKRADTHTNKTISYARFVYYAFNRDFDVDNNLIIIRQINGDKNDFNLSNLEPLGIQMIKQGEHSVSAKLTDKEVEEIKSIYLQSENIYLQKNNPNKKISCRKLAEIYGVSHSTINGIINGKFRNKENYIIK